MNAGDGEEVVQHRPADTPAASLLRGVHGFELAMPRGQLLRRAHGEQLPRPALAVERDRRVGQAIGIEGMNVLRRAVGVREG